jgi:adenosylcobinamide-GDP ribazoletransferase
MLAALRLAFSFLTRLPVGTSAAPVAPGSFGLAASCFPVVGATLGVLALLVQALVLSHAGSALTSLVLVALSALLTGGLHLDGLADTFDGLGGYHGNRQRMLEIMRDPRIGAHGATALGLCLLTKVSVTSELLSAASTWPLVAAPMCARFCVLPLLRAFPYVRADGLGVTLHAETHAPQLVAALAVTLIVLVALDWRLLWPAACCVIVAMALGFWISKRLGGLTGDVYGAAIELSELAFLIAADRA